MSPLLSSEGGREGSSVFPYPQNVVKTWRCLWLGRGEEVLLRVSWEGFHCWPAVVSQKFHAASVLAVDLSSLSWFGAQRSSLPATSLVAMEPQGALSWQRGGLSTHPDVLNLCRDFSIYTYLSSFENQMRVIGNIRRHLFTIWDLVRCRDGLWPTIMFSHCPWGFISFSSSVNTGFIYFLAKAHALLFFYPSAE